MHTAAGAEEWKQDSGGFRSVMRKHKPRSLGRPPTKAGISAFLPVPDLLSSIGPEQTIPRRLASGVRRFYAARDTAGGLMDRQSKLDLAAAGAILVMFIGAYALTISRLGLLLIVTGVVAMLFLFSTAIRTRQ
jgi:hypothetical protein